MLTLVLLLSGFCLAIGFMYILRQRARTSEYLANAIKLEEANQRIASLDQEILVLSTENLSLIKDKATMQAEAVFLREKLETSQTQDKQIQESLQSQFKLLAEGILEDKTKKFTAQNQTNIESILKPLSERIEKFERAVVETHRDNIERSASLKAEVQRLAELSTKVNQEAENLSKAIKGDVKTQGSWGEFILENVLERSGLRKDNEYVVQSVLRSEDGKQYRPDVVVNLPDQKHIVIDSKVSLSNYEKYFNAGTLEEQQEELSKHLLSIKNHLKVLSQKSYQDLYELKSLDFVLMFVPIESAFGLAIKQEPEIFNYAYERNIIIVSPSTLLATLRTIHNIWQNEYRNKYAHEIARQSGEMYNKFQDFIADMNKIKASLDRAQDAQASAMKKLSDGNGNLLRRAERIKLLGAKTTKTIQLEV